MALVLRIVLVLLLGLCGRAAAEPASSDKDRARELAEQAGDALDAKNFQQAIELVTQAEALYHAPTHLIIAAEAHEGLGALVEAAELYERVVAEPLPAGAPPAFKAAQSDALARVRALISRIPSLLVRVSPASASPQLTLDGQPFDGATDVARRVNPGKHTLRATLAGYENYEKTLELKRGGVTTIDVVLQRVSDREEAGPAPAPAPAPPSAPAERRSSSKLPAFVAFGVGAVGLGVGAVTGKMSLDRVSELEDQCPERRCSPEQKDDIDDARLLGTISTVGFGVGAAGVAAGVVLLVLSGSSEERPAASRRGVQPWLGVSSVGVRGSF